MRVPLPYAVARRRYGLPGGSQAVWDRIADRLGPNWLPMVVAWPALAAVVALLLFTLYMTFVPGLPTEGGFTLSHWANLARPYVLTTVIPNTLLVGVGTVLVNMTFALPLSWILNRALIPGRSLFVAALAIVVVIPGFVTAMAWMIMVNERTGLLNTAIAGALGMEKLFFNVDNTFGMAWVLGLSLTPSMFFMVSGSMRSIGADVEEAAAASGASWWQRQLRVTLPLLKPAILSAAIYNFMTAIAIFEVPALLGGAGGRNAVLSTELFYAVHPTAQVATIQFGAAGVYGMLIVLPSLVALYFYYRVLAQGQRYQVITGKAYRAQEVALGRWKYPALAFVLGYFLMAVVLPFLVLVWVSFLPFLQFPSVEALSKLTTANYAVLPTVIGGLPVIVNTLLLIAVVPLLVLLFSFMTSWIVVRTRSRLRQPMDVIAVLPHAIPGTAFAFGLFMFALAVGSWLPLGGTLAIIVIAQVLHFLASGTRIMNSALLQVHRELQEAAQTSGASELATMWRVMLPLLKPSLLYAVLWIALLSAREVSMALFLTGAQNKVFSVTIWTMWQSGKFPAAAAASVVLIVAMGLLALGAVRLAGGAVGVASREAARKV
jgi:iron(III) transport system permease protein